MGVVDVVNEMHMQGPGLVVNDCKKSVGKGALS